MFRKAVLILLVASLAIAAGCAGDDAGDAGGYESRGDGDAERSAAEEADGQRESSAATATAQDGRQLIRTGELVVTVDAYRSSRANLTERADEYGGFLAESEERTREYDDRTRTTGTLTYRVPSENFAAFYVAVEAEGNVTRATTGTEDVTDRLVDLNARIGNLETQRDRLRTLYEEADETEDVLAVEERLSDVQEEIERLEAQRASLRDRVAYSTVTVTLEEPTPDSEAAERAGAWYETSVVRAFLSSVSGVATVARATVVAAAYAAPYLLAFGTPVALLYGASRRLRAGTPEEEREPSEEPPDR